LTWDPKEWDGVDEISLDASELWIPDVVLYNGEQVSAPAVGFRNNLPKVRYGPNLIKHKIIIQIWTRAGFGHLVSCFLYSERALPKIFLLFYK
jgi:hypothetical protein